MSSGASAVSNLPGGMITPRKRGRPRKHLAEQGPGRGREDESTKKRPRLVDRPGNDRHIAEVTVVSPDGSSEKSDLRQLSASVEEISETGRPDNGSLTPSTRSHAVSSTSGETVGSQMMKAEESSCKGHSIFLHVGLADSQDMLTPRRSGRGVVPNRRFHDMELDFGRRKTKEDLSDEKKSVKTNRKTKAGDGASGTAGKSPSAKISEDCLTAVNVKLVKKKKFDLSSRTDLLSAVPVVLDPSAEKDVCESLSQKTVKTLESLTSTSEVHQTQRVALVQVAMKLAEASNGGASTTDVDSRTTLAQTAVFSDTKDEKVNNSKSAQVLMAPAKETNPVHDVVTDRTVTGCRLSSRSEDVQVIQATAGNSKSPGRVVIKTDTGMLSHDSQSLTSGARIIISSREVGIASAKSDPRASTGDGQAVFAVRTVPEKEDLVMSYVTLAQNKTVPVVIAERRKNIVLSVEGVTEHDSQVPCLHAEHGQVLQSTSAELGRVLPQERMSEVGSCLPSGQHVSEEVDGAKSCVCAAETSCTDLEVSVIGVLEDDQTELVASQNSVHMAGMKQDGDVESTPELDTIPMLHGKPAYEDEVANSSIPDAKVTEPMVEYSDMFGQMPPTAGKHEQQAEVPVISSGRTKMTGDSRHSSADNVSGIPSAPTTDQSCYSPADNLTDMPASPTADQSCRSPADNLCGTPTTGQTETWTEDPSSSAVALSADSGQATPESCSAQPTVASADKKNMSASSVVAVTMLHNKFSTSGTQTPYHRKSGAEGSIITIRVQPPSNRSSGSQSELDDAQVEKTKDETDPVEVVIRDDGQVGGVIRDDGQVEGGSRDGVSVQKVNERYIVVSLPEGATVKQHVVPTRDRLEDDPSYYSVDEAGYFTCVTCDYKTTKKANFYKHKRKHLGIRPHKCDVCSYSAATSSNLKRHMAIHADLRNYKCSICKLNFRQKIHLERHIKYRHEEKKVKCPLCDYICANENPDLKVHLKRKHATQGDGTGPVTAFTCKECGVVAVSRRDLRQHTKFHTKGPELKLFCQMCSFVTDCESRLRRHMFIHTKEKPFQCGMCDYRGSQKEHVLRHMRSVHNIEIVRKHRPRKEGQASRPGGDGETPGQRPLDRADYSSDEKIFACNHCTMKFAKLINLYKHLHTQHRDIMPAEQGSTFSCVVCDYRTSSKKNLLVHMRKHNTTDQSPPSHVYSCVLCRYMNPKRRNLFQHMRKKHHIEIILRDDGTTTCFITNDTFTSAGPTTLQLQNPAGEVGDLPLGEVITAVSQTTLNQDDGGLEGSSSTTPLQTVVKMEDLALVVSNPDSAPSVEGPLIIEAGSDVAEGLNMQSLSQHEAAEAIQGLQALSQHRVLEASAVVEEQVQVMGSDEQNTLVIDPCTLGVVEQLVTPKSEPLEVVEIEQGQLLEDVTQASTICEDDAALLGVAPSRVSTLSNLVEEVSDGLQLSAEQLMNLTTGDYLEINGEMYKVEVSMEDSTGGGVMTHQVINILPSV